MIKNLRVMRKAQAEVRESRKNCVVNGFEIPSKTRVIVNAWAIGKDPNHWLPRGMKQEDIDMTEVFGVFVRRTNNLVLVPSLYRASIIVALRQEQP
ncbi:hypothetical protein Gotri_026087 [Gossypium trilobum]|uniref:Cytochrome P450 n=1 Tax=Gossypium trilobum TaxID=34281 RepID=A0A7J9FRE7_9ROSI|nr:hypothetical protein [Gossypium trilobum]